MDFIRELGDAVRKARKEARLTQIQLAELIGISDKTMRDIERGTGTPSLAHAIAAAEAVGVQVEIHQ